MALRTLTHKIGETNLITKLLGTTLVTFALLVTSVSAEPVKQPTTVELQQEVTTLQVLVQTIQDQRNSILDQLAEAQVVIRQVQAAETAKKTTETVKK